MVKNLIIYIEFLYYKLCQYQFYCSPNLVTKNRIIKKINRERIVWFKNIELYETKLKC